jgi:hypothetical protein
LLNYDFQALLKDISFTFWCCVIRICIFTRASAFGF